MGVQRGLSGLQGDILAIISGRITAFPSTLPHRPPGCSWSSDLEFACGHGEKEVRQEEVQKGPREPTRQSLFPGRGETWRFGEFDKMFWHVDTSGRESESFPQGSRPARDLGVMQQGSIQNLKGSECPELSVYPRVHFMTSAPPCPHSLPPKLSDKRSLL